MKHNDHISILANVLTMACSRPSAEVGKLVNVVVAYANDGIRTTLDDIRLETYFDLIAQDLDSQRKAADEKSRKCSESAKCRNAKSTANASRNKKETKVTNQANAAIDKDATNVEDASDQSDASDATDVTTPASDEYDTIPWYDKPPELPTIVFDASDAASSFAIIKEVYGKIGDNELQAFGMWQQLTESERTAAYEYACRIQGTDCFRAYLYVFLRDRRWHDVKPQSIG